MTKRKGLTSTGLQQTNREKILKALEEENLAFQEFLDKIDVSRGTLATHLRELYGTGEIEKVFDKEKNRVVYCLTEKGVIPLTIESMIRYLGLVATYGVFARKLKIKPEFDINEEIENYVKAKSKISPEMFHKYLQEYYPLTI